MARVITFSTKFPGNHPRKGEPTHFVQKILHSLVYPNYKPVTEIGNPPKFHTIRKGNRWQEGEWFSPRIWGNDINPKTGRSGPYHSKQITIADDIQIKKIWEITIKWDDEVDEIDICIDGRWFCQMGSEESMRIAKNDGLNIDDFKNWFNPKNKPIYFVGQIICWNDTIKYDHNG